jgi:glycosyltransferase involved in cell wall biosynthesis
VDGSEPAVRILYLSYGSQSGVTAAVVGRLRAAGHEVRTFDPVAGFLYKRRLGPLRVPNVRLDAILATAAAVARFGPRWKSWYVHTCWAFDRLTARCDRAIAAFRPDAILQAGCLFAPGRDPGVPTYVYCDHTRAINEAYPPLAGLEPAIPFEPGWRCREAAVYRRAAAIFSMSDFARASLVATYRVDADRVHVVGAGPNVVAEDLAGGWRAGAGASAARAPRTFLFVGKEFARKGGPELLAAFAAVRARCPDAELWMVGGQQPVRAPAGVRLLGRVPLVDVARLYRRASVFVLPTLREPFGLAYLEAMSFGLPCIGTTIEAIPEIVEDGVTGRLVPPRDVPALAAAMLALADDPARAAAMGQAGRARVAQRFGWDRAVERMLQVVEGRAARAGEPPSPPRARSAPLLAPLAEASQLAP